MPRINRVWREQLTPILWVGEIARVTALPGPNLVLLGRSWAAFRVCGIAGFLVAASIGLGLAREAGESATVMAAVVVAAAAAFLARAMLTKVMTGAERLVYYYDAATVLGVAALIPFAAHRPVLPYLDSAAVGLGAFLVCGRIGCLLAGCCHGRPSRAGVRYGEAHATEGFPRHLVGVTLVPVQAIESAGIAVIAVAGVVIVVADAAPGTALVWQISGYAVLRFGLEFLRGDPARRYAGGFSEAQLTSVALCLAAAAAGAAGLVPSGAVAATTAAGLMAAAGLVAIWRRGTGPRRGRLMRARHVEEIGAALDHSDEIARTSLGLLLSQGRVEEASHYTLSVEGESLTAREARELASLVTRLRHHDGTPEVVRAPSGVVHVLVRRPPIRPE